MKAHQWTLERSVGEDGTYERLVTWLAEDDRLEIGKYVTLKEDNSGLWRLHARSVRASELDKIPRGWSNNI